MAEHIEREALENAFEDENKNGNFVFTANWIMEILDNLPPADVVPKSDVEQLKQDLEIAKIAIENRNIEIEGMRTAANSYKMHYEKVRGEVAREIFEEIEKVTPKDFTKKSQDFEFGYKIAIQEIIAELKRKYTEVEG